jgi:hypothetical protein
MAAMDTYPEYAEEITMLLLIAGLKQNEKDNDGFIPEELAIKAKNNESLLAFKKFNMRNEDSKIAKKIDEIKAVLSEKYTFVHDPTMLTEKWEADFIVPDFVFKDDRTGELPVGMIIHEHHISPLIEEGYSMKTGVDALRTIDFAREQAEVNEQRRIELIQSAGTGTDWEPVDRRAIMETHKKQKKRGAKRVPNPIK